MNKSLSIVCYCTSRDLLGQQGPTDATLNLKVALLAADPVVVTAQTTGRHVLGVVCRVWVEATGDATQLVLQTEDAGRARSSHGALGRVQHGHAADTATHGHLVEDDKQEGDHNNLGHLHFTLGWEKRLR